MAQAFALERARAIITLTATRKGRASNVVWRYGHTTIPRHLRDIVVTEYGIADLRGRSDRDCIAAMLGLADARFQNRLLTAARRAGKIEPGFRLAEPGRNTSSRIAEALAPARVAGWCRAFPFGTDFTETEQRLMPALARLRDAGPLRRGVAALVSGPDDPDALARLDLGDPSTSRSRLLRPAVLNALATP